MWTLQVGFIASSVTILATSRRSALGTRKVPDVAEADWALGCCGVVLEEEWQHGGGFGGAGTSGIWNGDVVMDKDAIPPDRHAGV